MAVGRSAGGRPLGRAHLFHKGNNEIVSVEKLPTCFIIRGSPAERGKKRNLICDAPLPIAADALVSLAYHSMDHGVHYERARAPPTFVESTLTAKSQWMDADAVAATHYYVILPRGLVHADSAAVRLPPTRRRGIMRLMPLQHVERCFTSWKLYTLLAGAQHNLSLRCQFKMLHSLVGRWQFAKCVARSFVLSPKVVESIS